MPKSTRDNGKRTSSSQPLFGQSGPVLQKEGELQSVALGLSREACEYGVKALNELLADSLTLRDMYKKHHWQVSGPTFIALHELFDKHFAEQVELVDDLAERVQTLGGVSIAMGADSAERTRIERPPLGRESPPVQLSRLIAAHELIIVEARKAARRAEELGDDGTNDMLVGDIVRTNELQAWFLSEHLANMPLTRSSSTEERRSTDETATEQPSAPH